MVKMMVHTRKTDVKHSFGTKQHFPWDKFTKIGPVKSENHFLLKEIIKNRSHMVKMRVYIQKKTKRWKQNFVFGWFPHGLWVVLSCLGPVLDHF